MIQSLTIKLFCTLITAEMVLIMMVLFKTSLRKLALLGLDRLKRGRGLLVLKTIHGTSFLVTSFLVLLYSVYSMIKIQKRILDEAAVNPTDQVLMAKHLLEVSLFGFSLFLALMLIGLHNFNRELQLLGKDMEAMKKQKREAELVATGFKERERIILENDVTCLKRVNYQLHTAVDVKTKDVMALKGKVYRLQTECEAKTKDVMALKEKVNRLQTECEAKTKDVMALKEKVNRLEIECEAKTKDVKAGEASIIALKKQSEGLGREYDRLLEENQNLRNQLRSIDRSLSRSDYKKNT